MNRLGREILRDEKAAQARDKALELKPIQYYAAAREYGWEPGDEDTAKEYCEETEGLTRAEIVSVDVDFWREEYEARASPLP